MFIYGSKASEQELIIFNKMNDDEKNRLLVKVMEHEDSKFIGVECPSKEINKGVFKLSELAFVDEKNINQFLRKLKLNGEYFFITQ